MDVIPSASPIHFTRAAARGLSACASASPIYFVTTSLMRKERKRLTFVANNVTAAVKPYCSMPSSRAISTFCTSPSAAEIALPLNKYPLFRSTRWINGSSRRNVFIF